MVHFILIVTFAVALAVGAALTLLPNKTVGKTDRVKGIADAHSSFPSLITGKMIINVHRNIVITELNEIEFKPWNKKFSKRVLSKDFLGCWRHAHSLAYEKRCLVLEDVESKSIKSLIYKEDIWGTVVCVLPVMDITVGDPLDKIARFSFVTRFKSVDDAIIESEVIWRDYSFDLRASIPQEILGLDSI